MSTLPPPGWYTDPTGQPRWWDGAQWALVPAAGPHRAAGTSNPRTMGLVAHLGGLIGGWITPLIVYLVDGGRDRFVRHNASEGLNFQLTLMLVSLVLFVPMTLLFWVPLVAASSGGGGAAVGGVFGWMAIVWLAAIGMSILNLVWSIMGMVRANRGEWWQYPVRIRFVKGFVPEAERYPV